MGKTYGEVKGDLEALRAKSDSWRNREKERLASARNAAAKGIETNFASVFSSMKGDGWQKADPRCNPDGTKKNSLDVDKYMETSIIDAYVFPLRSVFEIFHNGRFFCRRITRCAFIQFEWREQSDPERLYVVLNTGLRGVASAPDGGIYWKDYQDWEPLRPTTEYLNSTSFTNDTDKLLTACVFFCELIKNNEFRMD